MKREEREKGEGSVKEGRDEMRDEQLSFGNCSAA
jgi:hypothetical protein